MSDSFTKNPDYRVYEGLLIELHKLIARGEGDSAEADNLRDQMEGPWKRLNKAERHRLDGLSADLYLLQDDEVLLPPVGPELSQDELRRQVKEYQTWNDWDSVLGLLRRRPKSVPPEAVAISRARAYAALGLPTAASQFSSYVLGRKPSDENLKTLHLFLLADAGQIVEAGKLARIWIQEPSVSPNLLLAASAVLLESAQNSQQLQEVIQSLSRGLSSIATERPANRSVVALGLVAASEAFRRMGKIPDSIAALDQAITLDPGDPELYEARNLLHLNAHDDAAGIPLRRASEKLRAVSVRSDEQGRISTALNFGKAA